MAKSSNSDWHNICNCYRGEQNVAKGMQEVGVNIFNNAVINLRNNLKIPNAHIAQKICANNIP